MPMLALCLLCFGIVVISAICWQLWNNSPSIHFPPWNVVFQPNSMVLTLCLLKRLGKMSSNPQPGKALWAAAGGSVGIFQQSRTNRDCILTDTVSCQPPSGLRGQVPRGVLRLNGVPLSTSLHMARPGSPPRPSTQLACSASTASSPLETLYSILKA